jgi:integrase/recombinase XerC
MNTSPYGPTSTEAVGKAHRSDELAAAVLLLDRMGVSPADLIHHDRAVSRIPTFAEYVPVVTEAVSAGTIRTYHHYWHRIVQRWGDRRLDDPTPSEIRTFAQWIKANITVRRNSRDGRGAVETFVSALRCIYAHAVDDGIMERVDNPSLKVRKPTRLPNGRHALLDQQLAEINHVAATTGNDPVLDTLLLRFHIETACRRGGALALRFPDDLDADQCLVRLREKGDSVRWQPISPTLMMHLRAHGDSRCAAPGTALFRYRTGKPITSRRYDGLWSRLGDHLPWVAAQQVTVHWLRYTTLTWVERNFSYAVARAYAGHVDVAATIGATATYVRAGIREVATALTALTGESHPLALPTIYTEAKA